jgi:bacterioferritin
MKGDATAVKALNEVLTGHLTAINQYFLHAKMLSDWGYEKIASVVYKESIRQMKAAEKVTDRILLLEGLPNYQKLLNLKIGENASETLQFDKALCEYQRQTEVSTVKRCLDCQDHGSRELVERLVESEESHLNWLEAQHSIINEIGIENYLAEQI